MELSEGEDRVDSGADVVAVVVETVVSAVELSEGGDRVDGGSGSDVVVLLFTSSSFPICSNICALLPFSKFMGILWVPEIIGKNILTLNCFS